MPNGQRYWSFTFFHDSMMVAKGLLKRFAAAYCKYMIFEEETCPNTGKKHLQGYLVLRSQEEMGFIKSRIYPSIHLAPSNRGAVANI